MIDWKKYRIGDIAEFNTWSINKDFDYNIIEYIDTSSVEKGRLLDIQILRLKEAPSRAKRRIKINDILISTVRPNLQHYYFVKDCKDNTIVSTGFVVITPTNKVDPYFLYCLLTTPSYTKYLTQIANSHTSTYPSFNPDIIEDSIRLIPEKDEQIKISKILLNLDQKIDLLHRQNETLEAIAQVLFKSWFVDFEFPDENGLPYKSSGGKMMPSELWELPEGWKLVEFGDLLEKIVDNRGRTPPIEQDGILMMEGNQIALEHSFPVYQPKNKQKYVSELTYNNWFRDGHPKHLDILCATVGTLPKWCFAPKKTKICIAQNIVGLRSKENIVTPYFLKNLMNTYYFINSFNGRLLTTAQPSIKVGHLETINVVLPNYEIITKYSDIVKPMYKLIENKCDQIYNLSIIHDNLLPKLVSGQIRVT